VNALALLVSWLLGVALWGTLSGGGGAMDLAARAVAGAALGEVVLHFMAFRRAEARWVAIALTLAMIGAGSLVAAASDALADGRIPTALDLDHASLVRWWTYRRPVDALTEALALVGAWGTAGRPSDRPIDRPGHDV